MSDSTLGPVGGSSEAQAHQFISGSEQQNAFAKLIQPNDPWLLGMGSNMNAEEAVKFKAKMMANFCQTVIQQISQDQARAHKALKNMERRIEGKPTDP